MDIPEIFCCYFAKGDNFCGQRVASLAFENFQNLGGTLKKIIGCQWEQILSFESSLNEKEGKYFSVSYFH